MSTRAQGKLICTSHSFGKQLLQGGQLRGLRQGHTSGNESPSFRIQYEFELEGQHKSMMARAPSQTTGRARGSAQSWFALRMCTPQVQGQRAAGAAALRQGLHDVGIDVQGFLLTPDSPCSTFYDKGVCGLGSSRSSSCTRSRLAPRVPTPTPRLGSSSSRSSSCNQARLAPRVHTPTQG